MDTGGPDSKNCISGAEFSGAVATVAEANTLIGQGYYDKAQYLLDRVVTSIPDYVRAWGMLGYLHSLQKRMDQAVSCFAKAHYLCPLSVPILLDLAKAQKLSGLTEAAAASLERCNQLAPNSNDILFLLGDLYLDGGELGNALKAFRDALAAEPRDFRAMYGLAQVHLEMGDPATAISLCRMLLAQSDSVVNRRERFLAACSLANMNADISEEELTRYSVGNGDNVEAIQLQYALAAVYIKQDRCIEAWDSLVAAKRLQGTNEVKNDEFQRRRRQLALDYAKALVLTGRSTPYSSAGPQLIYIFGASRSGKTTLERCLARRVDIQPTYEIPTIDRALLRVSQLMGLPNAVDPWILKDVPDQVIRDVFMDQISEISEGRRYLTNTNPNNIVYAGLIGRLFPTAKFIFLTRNRDDQAFSIFKTHYEYENYYSKNINKINEYIEWYESLIEIWIQKMPRNCLSIKYENIFDQSENTIRTVFNFIEVDIGGLDFDIPDDRGCSEKYRGFMAQRGS